MMRPMKLLSLTNRRTTTSSVVLLTVLLKTPVNTLSTHLPKVLPNNPAKTMTTIAGNKTRAEMVNPSHRDKAPATDLRVKINRKVTGPADAGVDVAGVEVVVVGVKTTPTDNPVLTRPVTPTRRRPRRKRRSARMTKTLKISRFPRTCRTSNSVR